MKAYLSFLACAVLCACSHSENTIEQLKSVYLTSPEGGMSQQDLTFTGVVQENDNISLGFKTPGQIKRILVKEGDHVKSGQLLAVLDDEDYQLGVEALQTQYDQVKDEVERAKRLFEKKSMTANDYEKATAGLKQLGIQLQVNKNKLAYTRLYAPVAGVIETVNYSPAEMVDAGTPVFTMIGSGPLEVVCDVTARTYEDISHVDDIYCIPTNSKDSSIPLRMLGIVPKADANQLYRMKLGLTAGNTSILTPGSNVTVCMRMANEGTDGLLVPASSVFKKGDNTFVWVMKPDSTVTAREVKLNGTINGKMTGVESGLSGDDKVVRAGVSMLHEGEKVKVIEKASASNVGELL